MTKKKSTENIVNEPLSKYSKVVDEIRVFSSFEEMNEADAIEMANKKPEEHLSAVTAYLKIIYKKELAEQMDLTIHFKKNGHSNS